MDAGVGVDAGLTDAGAQDAGLPSDAGQDLGDGGLMDAGAPMDAGPEDAGLMDAGMADAGLTPYQCMNAMPCDSDAECGGGTCHFRAATDANGCCTAPTCSVTLCINGAGTRTGGGNGDFATVCDAVDGVIEDCGLSGCYGAFSANYTGEPTDALDALHAALDADQSGIVDSQDPPCAVTLVGYSWGGTNVVQVAENMVTDTRFSVERAVVNRMVLVDPYSPLVGSTNDVPVNVAESWTYRQSISTPDDCSVNVPLGPFNGLPPTCAMSSTCTDYDYSLSPNATFMDQSGLFTGFSERGQQVGHCSIVRISAANVLANVLGMDGPSLPATVPVEAR